MTKIDTLRSLLPAHEIAMLTSASPSGALHARPLRMRRFDQHGHFWFIVNRSAEWVAGLGKHESINLSFTDDEQRTWVSVSGSAHVVDDDELLGELSDERPSRISTKEAVLLDFEAETVEYWDSPANALQSFVVKSAEVLGIESAATIGTSGQFDID